MKVTTIGFDLAKNVFQVRGVDERGHVVVRKQLRRDQVAGFFANLSSGWCYHKASRMSCDECRS